MVTPGCLKGWGNEWRVCSLVLPTPSLLSLVHNSLHSQLLATVFLFLPVVHTRGRFDCTPQHFSHSPAHLLPPTDTQSHIKTTSTNKTCSRTLHRHRYLRYRDTHSLNYSVWRTNHKAPSFFSSALFATTDTDWKDQQGDFYCSNQPSRPASITAWY